MIKWTPEFEVGLYTIDKQHKELVAIVNNLVSHKNKTYIKEKETFEEIKEILFNISMNFSVEETLMKKYKIDKKVMEKHTYEHSLFIKKMGETIDAHKNSKTFTLDSLTFFLIDWIETHVKKIDKLSFTKDIAIWIKG